MQVSKTPPGNEFLRYNKNKRLDYRNELVIGKSLTWHHDRHREGVLLLLKETSADTKARKAILKKSMSNHQPFTFKSL